MSKTNGKAGDPPSTGEAGVFRDEAGRILPGSQLNPAGARKSYAAQVRVRLNGILDAVDTDDEDKRERLDVLLLSVYARAVKGDMAAAKLILDRVYPATLQIDANVTGMTSTRTLDVFDCMAADYVKAGRLPDLTDRD